MSTHEKNDDRQIIAPAGDVRLGRNYSKILEQWQMLTKEKGADIVVLDSRQGVAIDIWWVRPVKRKGARAITVGQILFLRKCIANQQKLLYTSK